MSPHSGSLPDPQHGESGSACPACLSSRLKVFYSVEGVPTNSCILLDDREEAMAYPTGNIHLSFCLDCGFIFNQAFDSVKTEYSARYEETQAFSGTFSAFHQALAERLIKRYDLHDKTVLEIGCGKGEFLMLLAELGHNRGIGIDPGVHIDRITGPAAERMTFIQDFYSEKYANHKVDFLACKMTLEHIPQAYEFMFTIRRGLGEQTNTVVFFQIPEASRIISECAFEDIYYEHCGYFTPGSLARLFRGAGFEILRLETEYDDQYLTIEARPRSDASSGDNVLEQEEDFATLQALVDGFPAKCEAVMRDWKRKVIDLHSSGRKVVLWGSGSKAVSFLTTLALREEVAAVTDINPNRHGHFLPTTGHEIVPPARLCDLKPDAVIVMNRIYEREIRDDLAKLGVETDVMCL
jgi:SAM-dependent methyltransferase